MERHFASLREADSPLFKSSEMRKRFGGLLKKLMEWKGDPTDPTKDMDYFTGPIFASTVEPEKLGLVDYHKIILEPMDLGDILKRLHRNGNKYKTPESVARDVRLVYNNATRYNGDHNPVTKLAMGFLRRFEAEYADLMVRFREDEEVMRQTESLCRICGGTEMPYLPPVFYCNNCVIKIKRNGTYYSPVDDKTVHFCSKCYRELPDIVEVQGDHGMRNFNKRDIVQCKHNSNAKEDWIQCDVCNSWNHMVCSLFNARKNSETEKYTCPQCLLDGMKNPMKESIPRDKIPVFPGAKDLKESKLSDYIQNALDKVCHKWRRREARIRGVDVSRVDPVPTLFVRVLSQRQNQSHVSDVFQSVYSEVGYPKHFDFVDKNITLFQTIDGADVQIFSLFVQEYGADCPPPNSRSIYIAYLDSVKYFDPPELRTKIYHELLMSYVTYQKRRGFHSLYIWSCPPEKGDDYIIYAHPPSAVQKTPSPELLRGWYFRLLDELIERGVALYRTNLIDEHMNGSSRMLYKPNDATTIPYLKGDYWIGVCDKIIKDYQKEKRELLSPAERRVKVKAREGDDVNAASASAPRRSNRRGRPSSKMRDAEEAEAEALLTERSAAGGSLGGDGDGALSGSISASSKKPESTVKVGEDGYDIPFPKTDIESRMTPILRSLRSALDGMKEDFIVTRLHHQCCDCANFISHGVRWVAQMTPLEVDGSMAEGIVGGDVTPAPSRSSSPAPTVADGGAGDAAAIAATVVSSVGGSKYKLPPGASKRVGLKKEFKGMFQVCDKCFKARGVLENGIGSMIREDETGGKVKKHRAMVEYPVPLSNFKAIAVDCDEELAPTTGDPDEPLEGGIIADRTGFLSRCQGNHYQFDTLRRAKHSTMMVLYHLHNPDASHYAVSCNSCSIDINDGYIYKCRKCKEFDLCEACYNHGFTIRHQRHMGRDHVFVREKAKPTEEDRRSREERQRQIKQHMELLVHATKCEDAECKSPNCPKMKALLKHGKDCKTRAHGGCAICRRIWALLHIHARSCLDKKCQVPRCDDLKEHLRRRALAQDRRRREAYEVQHREWAATRR